MKRIMSLVFCALMAASLCLTAFAADVPDDDNEPLVPASTNEPEIESQSTCAHHWGYTGSDCDGYVVRSRNSCAAEWHHNYRCDRCYVATREVIEYMDEGPHRGGAVYNATCNGAIQTWNHNPCSRCGVSYTTTQACQGKDHKNGCQWLPV